jgi:hypothetical protein
MNSNSVHFEFRRISQNFGKMAEFVNLLPSSPFRPRRGSAPTALAVPTLRTRTRTRTPTPTSRPHPCSDRRRYSAAVARPYPLASGEILSPPLFPISLCAVPSSAATSPSCSAPPRAPRGASHPAPATPLKIQLPCALQGRAQGPHDPSRCRCPSATSTSPWVSQSSDRLLSRLVSADESHATPSHKKPPRPSVSPVKRPSVPGFDFPSGDASPPLWVSLTAAPSLLCLAEPKSDSPYSSTGRAQHPADTVPRRWPSPCCARCQAPLPLSSAVEQNRRSHLLDVLPPASTTSAVPAARTSPSTAASGRRIATTPPPQAPPKRPAPRRPLRRRRRPLVRPLAVDPLHLGRTDVESKYPVSVVPPRPSNGVRFPSDVFGPPFPHRARRR